MIINSVAVLGAGTMGAQIALHCANAGIPSLLLDLTPELARDRASRRRGGSSPIRSSRPTCSALVTTAGFDDGMPQLADVDWIMEAVVERLDIKQQLLARVDAARRPGLDRQLEHLGHPDRRARRRPQRRLPPALARHALLQPAALPAAARGDPDAGHRSGRRRGRSRALPTTTSARAWSSPRTRRTSSATTSRSTASCGRSKPWRAAATRSKRSTPSPGRRSAGRAAPRSARWTSPASTSSPTSCATCTSGCRTTRDRAAFAVPPLSAADARARCARREGRPGLLRAAQERERRNRDLDARPRRRSSTAPKQSARIAVDRSRQVDRRRPRARADAVQRARTRPASSCARRWRRRSSTPRASRRTIAHSIDDVDRVMRWGFGWELGPVRAVRRHRRARGAGGGAERPAVTRSHGGTPPLVQQVLDAGRNAFRDGSLPPAARRSADPPHGARTEPRRQEERRRQPRRSRRRRVLRRVPLEDERDRRRHVADAAGRRQGGARRTVARWSSATTRRTSRPAPT